MSQQFKYYYCIRNIGGHQPNINTFFNMEQNINYCKNMKTVLSGNDWVVVSIGIGVWAYTNKRELPPEVVTFINILDIQ